MKNTTKHNFLKKYEHVFSWQTKPAFLENTADISVVTIRCHDLTKHKAFFIVFLCSNSFSHQSNNVLRIEAWKGVF